MMLRIMQSLQWSRSIAGALCLCLLFGVTSSTSEEIRRTTWDGVPLDEPIHFRIPSVELRVPAGYVAPWPNKAMRGRIIEQNGISFNFWMPSRRSVDVTDTSLAGFRPDEIGRPKPGPESYVVKVRPLEFLRATELGDRSPEKRYHNLVSHPGLTSYSFKEEEFGLIRFWRNDWPHSQPEPFLTYRHIEGADPKILLRCTSLERQAQGNNPTCDGPVYFAEEEISLYVVFPFQGLRAWRENLTAARDLFKSWKVRS